MTRKTALFYGIITAVCAVVSLPASAQRSRGADDWCRGESSSNDRETFCEVREFTIPSSGSLTVDASPNGRISVEGAPRYDVHVRAKVIGRAETEERARQIATAVRVQPSGDRVEADGP